MHLLSWSVLKNPNKVQLIRNTVQIMNIPMVAVNGVISAKSSANRINRNKVAPCSSSWIPMARRAQQEACKNTVASYKARKKRYTCL